mmetsp:Transcript_4760/g.8311  ORF Transcript_4760/g.8311 Transcript_4760/m.8311 type:complete len:269 (-) Transcript_4760:407-1213(-)|eukprot:CAMPEP_0182446238 /NCGR_PEP_ID=MMETSP1172-20130603/4075_1 /TAXON_ID=708627 /ORGANISM="Timspurckia oligopyrenoides, Strain CCMP3278" /LENGTH=268 /DNA_ID=CAMNT_0024642139 /DNA_START=64 /DNA_END=870 /DNA_ORIENTATION=-
MKDKIEIMCGIGFVTGFPLSSRSVSVGFNHQDGLCSRRTGLCGSHSIHKKVKIGNVGKFQVLNSTAKGSEEYTRFEETTKKISGISAIDTHSLTEYDIFRDSPVRYCGYANEVGESFRYFIGSNGVILTYALASCYVVADSIYQTLRMKESEETNVVQEGGEEKGSKSESVKTLKLVFVAMDSLIWQSFASVICPGFIINRIVSGSNYALSHVDVSLNNTAEHWIPTVIGLAAMPLIVRPIDELVDHGMNSFIRPSVNRYINHLENQE